MSFPTTIVHPSGARLTLVPDKVLVKVATGRDATAEATNDEPLEKLGLVRLEDETNSPRASQDQAVPGAAVTETKSRPKNTPVTSPRPKIASASELASASSGVAKSRVPDSMTVRPGRNFSVAGFGVDSVWMNMAELRSQSVWNNSKETFELSLSSKAIPRQSIKRGAPCRHPRGSGTPLTNH